LTYSSEKYDFVSWDDYSQLNGKIGFHVPNHQPDMDNYRDYIYIDITGMGQNPGTLNHTT